MEAEQATLPGIETETPAETTPTVDPLAAELRTQNEQLREQNSQLQNFFSTQQQRRPQPPAQPNPQDLQAQQQQANEIFWQNPTQASAAIAGRAAMAAAQQLKAERYPQDVESAKTNARNQRPDIFDRYGSEIEAHVQQNYDPQHHTNPGVWEMAAKAVIADHIDDIAKARQEKKVPDSDGPAAPSFKPHSTATAKRPDQLNDEERFVAKHVYRDSPEEYTEGKKSWATMRRGSGVDPLDSAWASVAPRKVMRNGREVVEKGPTLTLDSELQHGRSLSA